MEIKIPQKVANNFQSYVLFSNIYSQIKQVYDDEIILNFEATKVFESNLFSLLASMIAAMERRRNKVRLIHIQTSIQNLFNIKKLEKRSMKKFLWKALVKCQHFPSSDEKVLLNYLETKIFPERAGISLDQHLKMAIQLCVAEVFRNAFAHSNCKEIFIAHYFSVYNKKLFISIVQHGKTIKQQAEFVLKSPQSGVQAIQWAVKKGTSSKLKTHQGIGFYTIRQFIHQNQGKIQIMSADGVWKQVKHRSFSKLYEKEFPGTVVTLEFNI